MKYKQIKKEFLNEKTNIMWATNIDNNVYVCCDLREPAINKNLDLADSILRDRLKKRILDIDFERKQDEQAY